MISNHSNINVETKQYSKKITITHSKSSKFILDYAIKCSKYR